MLQIVLDILEKGGVWGLFAATAIEASSIPFPGALFVLIYGYLMEMSPWQIVWISALNSFVYVLFSLIPYFIGKRVGDFSQKKLGKKKVKKAQAWFQKYGEWGIPLSRPTGFGNYISYISGMSDIALWRFVLLTYLGVFPWNTLLLLVGNSGSIERVQHFLEVSRKFGYIVAIMFVMVVLVWWFFIKKTKEQEQNQHS